MGGEINSTALLFGILLLISDFAGSIHLYMSDSWKEGSIPTSFGMNEIEYETTFQNLKLNCESTHLVANFFQRPL